MLGSGGTAGWYLTDRLGSVRGVTNGTGTPLTTLTYSGWGAVLSNSTPAQSDAYGFTGRPTDPATGLRNHRERDTPGNQWLQEDPSGLAPDVNNRRYVGNSPTNHTDPSGLQQPPVAFNKAPPPGSMPNLNFCTSGRPTSTNPLNGSSSIDMMGLLNRLPPPSNPLQPERDLRQNWAGWMALVNRLPPPSNPAQQLPQLTQPPSDQRPSMSAVSEAEGQRRDAERQRQAQHIHDMQLRDQIWLFSLSFMWVPAPGYGRSYELWPRNFTAPNAITLPSPNVPPTSTANPGRTQPYYDPRTASPSPGANSAGSTGRSITLPDTPTARTVLDGKGRTVYPDGATLKNSQGGNVAIPPGHTMSPRDPPMNAPPIIRRVGLTDSRGFTDAERAGFLAGNDGGTKVTPHHRHQIPVRDGGILDELPRRGHPEGDVHMGGSPSRHPNDGKDGRNGSIFNSEPGGGKLHADEVTRFFKDKGKRLVLDPNTGLWIDPLGQ